MTAGPPPEVVALAEARATARAARDFAAADSLRTQIAEAGWLVTDTADGFSLAARPPYDVIASLAELPDHSGVQDARRATVSVLVEGWPDDVRRCLAALLEHTPDDVVVQALDVGNVDGAGEAVHEFAAPRLEEWHLASRAAGGSGWAASRLALLRADVAAVHVWCDPSTVFTGDALSPLLDAVAADDRLVAAGWRGVDVDDDWQGFHDAGPGEVDALLGYLLAVRRQAALLAGGPHPMARFYRNADLEFSFALREATGGRLVVPVRDLPCRQERHRGYHDTDPAYRDRESATNYRRFLERFRGRTDLLAPRPHREA